MLGLILTVSSPVAAYAAASTTADTASTTLVAPRTNAGMEEYVRAYFADIPIMAEVARCESTFTQYGKSGKALHAGTNNGMIGLFQIHARIHRAEALSMGLDINTAAGNVAYARHLYEQEGLDPWYSSKACWGPLQSTLSEADQNDETKIIALRQQIAALIGVIAQIQVPVGGVVALAH